MDRTSSKVRAGVGFDDTCVDGKALTLDQPCGQADADHALEHQAQQIAVAEASMPILRESGVVRYRVVQIEPTEPAIGQMKRDLLAQLELRADAVAVADDQHAHHQFGINRGSTRVAVKGRDLTMDAGQPLGDEGVDPAEEMAGRDALLQMKGIEELRLVVPLTPHRRCVSSQILRRTESYPSRRHNRVLQQHREETGHS